MISNALYCSPAGLDNFYDVPAKFNFLIVPGYHNSGPAHWQTNWELLYPQQFTRVEQADWDYPEKESWINCIDKYIKRSSKPSVIVAHSLGCIAFVQWASQNNVSNIAGAMLVAPADADKSPNPLINAFSPVPTQKLLFPSVVVASINDPFAAIYRQASYAAYWESKFVSIGNKGHINAASNLGNWQEGLDILQQQLLEKIT